MILQKGAGPLGLSIVGGSDHSCVPFGIEEPGVFISKVRYFYSPIVVVSFIVQKRRRVLLMPPSLFLASSL